MGYCRIIISLSVFSFPQRTIIIRLSNTFTWLYSTDKKDFQNGKYSSDSFKRMLDPQKSGSCAVTNLCRFNTSEEMLIMMIIFS